MKKIIASLICILFLFLFEKSFAQSPTKRPHDWWQADWKKDSFPGISLNEAYDYLKGRKSKPVIVAILGESVAINHSDLKNSIWINKKEIPGNGIDDDHNGFVDDVHGWCFTADKNNTYRTNQLSNESRTYMEEKNKFKNIDTSKLDDEEKIEYDNYIESKSILFKRLKVHELAGLLPVDTASLTIDSARFKEYINHLMPMYRNTIMSKIPFASLSFINTYDSACNQLFSIITQGNKDWEFSLHEFDSLNKYQPGYFSYFVPYGLSYDKTIIDDTTVNYKSFITNDTAFGTSAINISSPYIDFMLHSTMMAGIIAAKQTDKNGVRGVSNNALIMPIVVAVPDKGAAAKDIIKGIYYAVNNGAKIINLSFRITGVEDHVKELRTAFDYADQHNVLIISSAGNSGVTNDNEKYFMGQGMHGKEHNSFIRVGATTCLLNDSLVSHFSNFGKKSVELFAPGSAIYSTAPDNKYETISGTSFSCPIVAGVAALLKSYFPTLTAKQKKEILMKSVFKPDVNVIAPINSGIKKKIPFRQMSKSGGIVNAYNAVKLADEITKKKNNNKL